MGGSSSTTSNQQQAQTQTNTLDPQYKQMLLDNYATAQGKASQLSPYSGQLTAGFTPAQTQSQGILSDLAIDPAYNNTSNQAVAGAAGVLNNPVNGNITAQTINPASYNASTYDPSLLSGANLSQYENPFQNDVINSTLAQLNQNRGQQQVADNASATAANAFGGTRQAVQGALTNQLYDQNTASTLASLNSANYAQAQQAALADAATKNNAAQYNSGVLNNAGQFNATSANTINQQNAANNLTGQQNSFNNALSSGNQSLNAAAQLQNLNTSALGNATTQAGILASVGDAQQQQQQTTLTNAYQAWQQGQNLTIEQQNILNSALGLIPAQQTVDSSGTSNGTSNTKTNSGLGGILGGVGSLLGGAAQIIPLL